MISYEKAKNLVKKDKTGCLYSKVIEVKNKKFEIFSYRYVVYDVFKKHKEAKELRGLCFDLETKKPYYSIPKFFNLNELEETSIETINDEIEIFDKVDGSLIQAFYIDNELFVKTKNSFDNNITKAVNKFIIDRENYQEFIKYCSNNDLFPQFEYIGPQNQIVLYYPEENLVLLHIRDNKGNFLNYNEIKNIANNFNIPVVKRINSTLENILKLQTKAENIEGWVIKNVNNNNHLNDYIKIKTKWYLDRHKLINNINIKTVWEKILNEEIDDLISFIRTININDNYSNNFVKDNIEKVNYYVKNLTLLFNKYYEVKDLMLKDWKETNNPKFFCKKWGKNLYFHVFMSELKGKEPKKWFLEYGNNDKKIKRFLKRFKDEYSEGNLF